MHCNAAIFGKTVSEDGEIEELCPNTQEMFHFFRRTQLKHIGTLTIEKLAGQMAMQTQVLAIVNTRKQAAGALPSVARRGTVSPFHPDDAVDAPVDAPQHPQETAARACVPCRRHFAD